MHSAPGPATHPAATLADELGAGRALLELLKSEQELLVNADVEGLGRASVEKGRLVAQMNDLAVRRHRSLAAAGFEASETGMQAWLARSKPAQHVQQSWNSLIELAQLAKELNRANGMLINQHLARTQNALNVLQGPPEGGKLYGPNGQATGTAGGRRLVVG